MKGTLNLNVDEFTKNLITEIKCRLDRETTVQITEMMRPNKNREKALIFQAPGQTSSPAVYIRPLYDGYLTGKTISALAAESINFNREHQSVINSDFAQKYKNFEIVKNQIVCRVINYDFNQELLKEVPHQIYHDLAVVYYYQIDDDKSVLIRNSHIALWGIDSSSLYPIALKNSRRLNPAKVTTLGQLVSETFDFCGLYEPKDSRMYILSNDKLVYGAVSILYDDVLSVICRQTGSEKIFILPSSVHEVLVIPADDSEIEPCKFKEIVREINAEYVAEEEILGDSIYAFDLQTGKLTIVA